MSEKKINPSRWYYAVAFLIPIFACVGTALFVHQSLPNLPGALEDVGIQNLTQVLIPGSKEIDFPKAGAYAVYYEYRSVIENVQYVRGNYPPQLDCQLISKTTGKDVELVHNYIEGNIYTTQNEERVGVHIMSITIENPGTYKFTCQYPGNKTSPKIVLAVGPNIVWELFNLAAKPIAALFSGTLMFAGTCGISVLMIIFVAIKRRQQKATKPIKRNPGAGKGN